jgi:hypothetical protein
MLYWGYQQNRHDGFKSEVGFSIVKILLTFASLYTSTLIAAFIFSNPQPDFTLRTIAPALLLVYLSLVIGSFWALSHVGRRWLKISILVPLLLLILGNVLQSRWLVNALHAHGRGYTSQHWQNSILLGILGDYPENIAIISNDSIAILLYHNRYAYDLNPSALQSADGEILRLGDRVGEELDDVFRDQGTILVLFDSFIHQLAEQFGGEWEQVHTELVKDLIVEYEGFDGVIYVYPKKDINEIDPG